jgi:hypothetical protein
MKTSFHHAAFTTAGGLLLAGAAAMAQGALHGLTSCSDFTPLTASAGPTIDESAPITFGNPDLRQESIADRTAQRAGLVPNSGSWDMNTLNETGWRKRRYLFTVFETGQSGVQRHDLSTGRTETIWQSPVAGGHVAFDASFWTPRGTFITAEESWCDGPTGCTSSAYGRLFEFKNPTRAPGIFDPVTATSNDGADFAHANVIPRTSHEGIQSGALTITDPRGVRSVDARNTTNLPAFKGTDYQRPEDAQVQVVDGRESLYFATTTTNEVYRMDLTNNRISVFVNRATID